MTESTKPAWPQTPDGTTDWEVVFEDPDTGFIQLIDQSPTPDILRQTTTVVIEKLFTRRGDEAEVTRLKNHLENILAQPGEIENKRNGVNGLLRHIKSTRIEKARIYVERKRAGAAIDRRSGWLWKIDFLLKPKVLIPLGIVFILSLSSMMYLILETTIGPSLSDYMTARVAEAPTDEKAAEEATTETTGEETGEETGKEEEAATETPPPEPTPKPDTKAAPPEQDKPVRITLKTLRWPLTSMSAHERPQYYAVILYVDNWDIKTGVCLRVATVMDRLYQIFNREFPQGRPAKDEELREAERITPNILNQIYPGTPVNKAEIIRYGDPRFQAALVPPFCDSPDEP